MNAKRVARGQIWHWNDPIYKSKKYSDDSPVQGESTVRYSRYVLVVQDSPIYQSVLVCPLSTKANHTNEYRIAIQNEGSAYETFSYLKLGRIFPVSVDQLSDYICTASEETMKLVEAEMIRILCPTVFKNSMIGQILIDNDLPLDQVSEDSWYDENTNLGIYSVISKFIKTHVQTGINSSISAYDLYEAYDAFCSQNDYIPPEERKVFLDLFCIMMHLDKDLTNNYKDYMFRNIRITGLEFEHHQETFIDNLITAVSTLNNRTNPKEEKHTKQKWDDETKKKFMEYESLHTVKETAEKFNISENSVYKYRKSFAEYQKPSITATDINVTSKSKGEIMDDVKLTLSSAANAIKNAVVMHDWYIQVENIDELEFRKRISSAAYYSLAEIMGIKEKYNSKDLKHDSPALLINSNTYKTLGFIAELNDSGSNAHMIMESLVKNKKGLPRKWLGFFKDQLNFRFHPDELTIDNVDRLVDDIGDMFCMSKEAPPNRKIA